ncbi:hypothetical protein F511_22968 [Dorcoceras hygrometricum]|uniref:Uncharacterized protein n=1 Tax=Dorcoceras hygrometricum TaxID=472368 RepID=A0A2Z7BXL1_9LAMI|nr:hypothetical protein F511_22968 [Dorcoceras hygrometricum]
MTTSCLCHQNQYTNKPAGAYTSRCILLRHDSFNCSNCFLTGHGTHNRRNFPGAKSVKASQYSAQILASTTYCLRSRTQIWFYLSQQLLTARTKLKTSRNTYPESHTHRRMLYSTVVKTHQLTASSRSLSNVEPGFLTGINRKSYSRRAQRHQSRSKQRRKSTVIYRIRVRMNSIHRGFTGENDEEMSGSNVLSVDQNLVEALSKLTPAFALTGYADKVQKATQYVQSSQPPQQQVAQQSGHQRFRPRGRQFKKKSGSSSSGSGSSSSGSSSKVEFVASVEEGILQRSV